MMSATIRQVKGSVTIPSLSCEMTHGAEAGQIAVTFYHEAAFDTFRQDEGGVRVDCSDRVSMPSIVAREAIEKEEAEAIKVPA